MAELSFIKFIQSLTDVEKELIVQLQGLIKPELYRNRQVFHSMGQVENRLWFVEAGLVRAYYFDHSAKEHTLQFYNSGDIVFSWKGLYAEPADFYLEALDACKLSSITYKDLSIIMEQFPKIRSAAHVVARRRLELDTFYSRLMTFSAEERYRQFRNIHPEIFRKVSIRMIATYLNMTRENLSKLITTDLR